MLFFVCVCLSQQCTNNSRQHVCKAIANELLHGVYVVDSFLFIFANEQVEAVRYIHFIIRVPVYISLVCN